ncbi:MAG: hypothetical protein J2P54_11680 [Bradyrhizobiaceae bacterium]|nr:hypothetical protein [Bradyrhizobiaceae bacterium]
MHIEQKVDAIIKAMLYAAAAGAAGISAFFFACLALFVWTRQEYGTVTASLVLAILFAAIAAAALLIGWFVRRRSRDPQNGQLRRAAPWWTDPIVASAALEVFRTVGSKRLVVVLLGAFVVGTLLDGPLHRQPSAEP